VARSMASVQLGRRPRHRPWGAFSCNGVAAGHDFAFRASAICATWLACDAAITFSHWSFTASGRFGVASIRFASLSADCALCIAGVAGAGAGVVGGLLTLHILLSCGTAGLALPIYWKLAALC
jgi:hypothetical protein